MPTSSPTEQIAELEYCEREQIPPGRAAPHNLLNGARATIRHNLAQAFCAGVDTPADAIDEPSPWMEWDDNGYQRVYTVYDSGISGARVQIMGYQNNTGEIYRRIFIDGDLDDLDSATARTIAAALTKAAHRLDQLN